MEEEVRGNDRENGTSWLKSAADGAIGLLVLASFGGLFLLFLLQDRWNANWRPAKLESSPEYVRTHFPEWVPANSNDLQVRLYYPGWRLWIFDFRPGSASLSSATSELIRRVQSWGWTQGQSHGTETQLERSGRGMETAFSRVRPRRLDGRIEITITFPPKGVSPAEQWGRIDRTLTTAAIPRKGP